MANQTITVNRNFDDPAIGGLLNGEDITIDNGAILTINSNPQWGLNNAFIGNITINNGECLIDGRNTRRILYSGGTGTLPVTGQTITGVTNNVIGEIIYRLTGSTLSSGELMVRSLNGVIPSNDTIIAPGFTARTTTQDSVGWLLIVGEELSTINVARLGKLTIRGEWYDLGTSNGLSGQTFNHYVTDYLPTIWVETSSGSGQYDLWLNKGTLPFSGFTNGEIGKVFNKINTSTAITFGNGINGSIPPNGSKIRVPNVHIASTTIPSWSTQTRTISATIGSWWDLTTSNTGVIDIDKCVGSAFYLSMSQPFTVTIKNTGVLQAIDISENFDTVLLDNVGVALFNQTIDQNLTFTISGSNIKLYNYKGISDFLGASTYGCLFSNIQDIEITGSTFYNRRGVASSASIGFINTKDLSLKNSSIIGDAVVGQRSDSGLFENLFISDQYISADTTTNAISTIQFNNTCNNFKIDNLRFYPNSSIPRNSLISMTDCSNFKIRNLGNSQNFLNLRGQMGELFTIGNNVIDTEFKRLYAGNTRTAFFTTNNSSKRLIFNNFYNSGATRPYNASSIDVQSAGIYISNNIMNNANGITTTQQAVFGTHFYDSFSSNTSGVIGLYFHEKTTNIPSVSSYIILSGTPRFNANGGLLMLNVNDQILYETPNYILGHSGFSNSNALVIGTNTNNHSFEYDIDKGTGFTGTYKTINGTNLSSETNIDPFTGIKLRIRIRCTVASTTNLLQGLQLLTTTNASIVFNPQSLYPLDIIEASITLTDLQPNSEVRIYRVDNDEELAGIENSTTSFTYNYLYEENITVNIVVHNLNYVYLVIENYVLDGTIQSIPIQQQFDRNYSNT